MQFHIRWKNVRLPSRVRVEATLMTLSVLLMALAGSAGKKWYG